jgi:hypothetical protein
MVSLRSLNAAPSRSTARSQAASAVFMANINIANVP